MSFTGSQADVSIILISIHHFCSIIKKNKSKVGPFVYFSHLNFFDLLNFFNFNETFALSTCQSKKVRRRSSRFEKIGCAGESKKREGSRVARARL